MNDFLLYFVKYYHVEKLLNKQRLEGLIQYITRR